MNLKTKSKSIIVLGAGGHSKVLLSYLRNADEKILGYTDLQDQGVVQSIPYLGTDEVIFTYNPEEVVLVNGIGGIGDNSLREKLFMKFKEKGYSFYTVIHEKAILTEPYELQEGAQIFAGAIIQPNVIIGANTIINSGVIVEHDCVIGKHVHIAPGSTLSGGVIVGDSTHIGTNSTVIQDIKIGKTSLIGAGSVVVDDIQDQRVCWGNPARERRAK